MADIQSRLPIQPLDGRAARWQAEQRVRLRHSTPSFRDMQIAAVAVASGLILVTINVKDFRPFEAGGLAIEDWSRP